MVHEHIQTTYLQMFEEVSDNVLKGNGLISPGGISKELLGQILESSQSLSTPPKWHLWSQTNYILLAMSSPHHLPDPAR